MTGVERRGSEATADPSTTVLVPRVLTAGELGDEPRRVATWSPTDLAVAVAAGVGSAAAAWSVCRFLLWRGVLPLSVSTVLVFLGVYSTIVRDQLGREHATDRVVTVLIGLGALLVTLPLVFITGFLLVKGLPRLRPSFFTQNQARAGVVGSGGGSFHAIVGTLEQVGLATSIAVPVASLTAIYLNELKGRMAVFVRFLVDAMSGVPSIVAGLLVYAIWVIGFGRGFSGLAGAMALVVLMLPTVARTSEEVLRTIPDSLREASLALGAPQWRAVLRVVLPTARTGLVTAVLLGIARSVGETAPMLLTARGTQLTNANPLSGQQSDLPLFVYSQLRLPDKGQIALGYTGALVLLLVVLAIFTTARVAGRTRTRR